MKILLCTLNSKYIHTNLALKYLYAMIKNVSEAKVMEFTINEDLEDILFKVTEEGYDVVAFSCYIWNIEKTTKIAENLKKIKPNVKILFGGPEVSFDGDKLFSKYPFVDYVIIGEGEVGLKSFVENFQDTKALAEISNLIINPKENIISKTKSELVITDLSVIPPIYLETTKEDIANKIVYYETSRGCTFNCAYCLSSTTKGVRFFNSEKVKKELFHLVSLGAKQIKFVDRTFNSNEDKAVELVEYLISIDDGKINFHFEITAYLLEKRLLSIFETARKGLFQFEIGVQSTNPITLKEVNRADKFLQLKENVKIIQSFNNIHQHLDLIAGLPFEDYNSFIKSFNDVFMLRPDVLQLGFLKLLKGSPIAKQIKEHGYIYRSYPPYEILENKFISYKEIKRLKEVEHIVDRFNNTGRFKYSLGYIYENYFMENGYRLFEELTDIIANNNLDLTKKDQEFKAMILLGRKYATNFDFYLELLKLEFLRMGRNPSIPGFLGESPYDEKVMKEYIFEFTRDKEAVKTLNFNEETYFKDILKKIYWSGFKFDVIQYTIDKSIIKADNIFIISYASRENYSGDYSYVRRINEI